MSTLDEPRTRQTTKARMYIQSEGPFLVLAAEEVRPDDGDHAQHQSRRQTLLRGSRIAVLLFASKCLERFFVFGGDARLIKPSFLRVPILLECIPRLQASVQCLVGLASDSKGVEAEDDVSST